MRPLIAALLVWLLPVAGLLAQEAAERPGWRDGFEGNEMGRRPEGWFTPTPACRAALSDVGPAEGALCVMLTRAGEGFANFMTHVDAAPYRGKRIRLAAQVRYQGPEGRAQLWLRADGPGGTMGFFDNMDDRPITADEWKTYEIIGDIGADAQSLALGAMFFGPGPVLIDDFAITILPPEPNADKPAVALDGRGEANLIALTRLTGYVRHFCPTDLARGLNWGEFTIVAVERVEPCATSEALASTLGDLFAPLSPALIVSTRRPEPVLAVPPGATHWTSLRHRGYVDKAAGNSQYQAYSTTVEREALDAGGATHPGTKPGTTIVADLGGGVFALVPIGAYSSGTATLPEPSGEPAGPDRPRGWRANGNDRSTRLAAVMLAWNVLQHFYPYFDVVETDWPATLRRSLADAATAPDGAAFQTVLERLGGDIHDGHVWVNGPALRPFNAPLLLTWVGEELVVERNPNGIPGVLPGDAIVEIDGEPTGAVYASLSERISAATPQWKRYRAAGSILASAKAEPVALTLRHADGTSASVVVNRTNETMGKDKGPVRPANGAELSPGVLYFNLDGAENAELSKWLPALADAAGVVFDLRGYPGGAGAQLLPHLADGRIQSASWNIPVFLMPDRQGVTFDVSNWDLPPQEPRIKGRVVFITDRRAISYAESCMGIVEAYKMGEIVGSATAGTNGNVTAVSLPGRCSLSFTGMKVVKHDGTAHHGRGIFPTIPAAPTIAGIAAGQDEVLDRAVEAASGKK